MAYDFDLVVIGGGPAGERGAQTAAELGKRVMVIERHPDPGGAMVHTGTLPSKTLRETALFLSGFRQRELYGVSVQLSREATVPKLSWADSMGPFAARRSGYSWQRALRRRAHRRDRNGTRTSRANLRGAVFGRHRKRAVQARKHPV
jgi:choline dehydrogenase-like flavoprotein